MTRTNAVDLLDCLSKLISSLGTYVHLLGFLTSIFLANGFCILYIPTLGLAVSTTLVRCPQTSLLGLLQGP